MNEFILVARLLLGLVFALSALTKLENPRGFIQGVERYGLLPRRSSARAAIALILLEAAVALSLLSGVLAQVGLYVAITLIMFFIAVMIKNSHREAPLPCYCFGSTDSPAHPRRTFLRLAFLLITALVVLLGWPAEWAASIAQPPTIAMLLLALGVLVLTTWLMQMPELLEWHETPVPQFANPGNRVSLRGVPLDPPHIHLEGLQ